MYIYSEVVNTPLNGIYPQIRDSFRQQELTCAAVLSGVSVDAMTYKAVDLVLTDTAVLARVKMAVIDCLEVIHVYTHIYIHTYTHVAMHPHTHTHTHSFVFR